MTGIASFMEMPDEWLDELRSWAKGTDSVRELWLFGSRATGRSRPDSDVDLATKLMPPSGNHNWALGNWTVEYDVWRQQLEAIVGCHVSLILTDDAPSDPRIGKNGILLWSRN